MARILSFIMSVFILVPAIAPSIGRFAEEKTIRTPPIGLFPEQEAIRRR